MSQSGSDGPLMIVFLGVIAVIIFAIWGYARKELARSDFDSALTLLRQKPSDSARYNAALQAANELADRTRPENTDRDTWRRSIRNEVELIRLQPTKVMPVPSTGSAETRLRKLADLYEEGLITQDEFSERKAEILDEI